MNNGVMRAVGAVIFGAVLSVSPGRIATAQQQGRGPDGGVAKSGRSTDVRDVQAPEIGRPWRGSGGMSLPEISREPAHFEFYQIRRGDPTRKELALTFDDGPHPPFTQRLLDLLKQLDVHATFFVVGRKVDQAPELLRRMTHEGHDVENHTYHHFNLKMVPAELTDSEIRLDNDAIRRACGRVPLFFRPSGGQYNAGVIEAAQRLHMVMALWTDDPGDYDSSIGSERIEMRLLNHVKPGAVILLHDGMEQTFAMLPDFVARMRLDGYRFVTITELAQHLEAAHHAHREQ